MKIAALFVSGCWNQIPLTNNDCKPPLEHIDGFDCMTCQRGEWLYFPATKDGQCLIPMNKKNAEYFSKHRWEYDHPNISNKEEVTP